MAKIGISEFSAKNNVCPYVILNLIIFNFDQNIKVFLQACKDQPAGYMLEFFGETFQM